MSFVETVTDRTSGMNYQVFVSLVGFNFYEVCC